jgi:hypothetical protein
MGKMRTAHNIHLGDLGVQGRTALYWTLKTGREDVNTGKSLNSFILKAK